MNRRNTDTFKDIEDHIQKKHLEAYNSKNSVKIGSHDVDMGWTFY